MKKQKLINSDPDSPELGSETAEKQKKRLNLRRFEINKRKIFIAVLALIIILVLLFIRYARHFDRRPTDTDNNPSKIAKRADVTGNAPVNMTAGEYTAGADIPPGRYLVTASSGYGSFVVYELGTNLLEISELIGYFAEPAYVPSVAVTLVENQKFAIKGAKLPRVVFTPLATELLKELSTGIWVVGLDIKPGTYTISSKDGRSGSVTVLEGYLPVAKFSLGSEGPNYKEQGTVTLISGQTIRISNIPVVIFKD